MHDYIWTTRGPALSKLAVGRVLVGTRERSAESVQGRICIRDREGCQSGAQCKHSSKLTKLVVVSSSSELDA